MTPAGTRAELDWAADREHLEMTELPLNLVDRHRIAVAENHKTRARELVDRETGIRAWLRQVLRLFSGCAGVQNLNSVFGLEPTSRTDACRRRQGETPSSAQNAGDQDMKG